VLADEFAKCVGTATIYQLPHHGSLTAGLESAAATDVPFAIESALVTCSELLRARRGLLQHEQFEALGRQLDALLSDEDELVAEGIVVSVVSLDGLIGFLARHRWAGQHPNIAITRDGRFSASWVHGWGAKVTLAFDTNGIGGEWVGVDIGTRPPVRREGAFVLDSLDGVLQPFRSWIKSA
jgi:hypothetical protein